MLFSLDHSRTRDELIPRFFVAPVPDLDTAQVRKTQRVDEEFLYQTLGPSQVIQSTFDFFVELKRAMIFLI